MLLTRIKVFQNMLNSGYRTLPPSLYYYIFIISLKEMTLKVCRNKDADYGKYMAFLCGSSRLDFSAASLR